MNRSSMLMSLAFTTVLSGCSTIEGWMASEEQVKQQAIAQHQQANQQVQIIGAAQSDLQQANVAQYQSMASPIQIHTQRQVNTNHTVKNINQYVQALMQDMVSNIDQGALSMPMAVTSFVFLDSDYQQGSLLGNQLAESFIHELHEFGVPVVDFKTLDYIRVTPTGDFTFSRDFLELQSEQNMPHVLAGTLVKHQGGVLVNARIVSVDSKMVIATSQGLLPHDVVDSLLSTSSYAGVELKQGN
ncbi:FlgO family outer membrane protein [Pseudoalteromonas sp. SSDWG2]|uniref:FlgO family outer membrane protein n=1 Tax=Pseudoalteromonas sp. SSDWG2 TaxID=3139391 RepID=UPI003BABB80C